jgi:HSP20 family protein
MARSLVPFVFDIGYPAVRGDPFQSLHRGVNRLFDDAMRGTGSTDGGSVAAMAPPHMNVSETGQDIRIEVELPGVPEQDVHVDLTDDLLTIHGEKPARREDAQHHVVERSFGSFARSIRLPFSPRADQVQASFAHGVLTITLPKAAAEARVHRIELRPGGGAGRPSSDCQGTAAAVAGHPTPDTTQGAVGQGGRGQGSTGPNDQGQVGGNPAPDNPGPGHSV